ncbi:[glutamate--ammonia-ligase] adenylyltransferase [Roseivivax isoporae]|uniref:Glutamate-ammonia ligase adenylyltransferase n=1 Tax=Roseivivax isoporae LMG 25204 TaxID=1449351 RepID=X7F6A0_9RHOB|nr:[glutamate--ammonia-ligase] adenylyltransferase [Roseivivax isoporae]ETX28340.1 glutamate-ammonia ligase adenylyltransferase [Roseivivax isoporae LMG 25204]
MTLADQMTRCPRPFDPDSAEDALARVGWAQGPARDLIAGAAGSSPHLHRLVEREADWLEGAMDDPDGALPALFDDLRAGAPDARADALRQGKRRVALLIALADLGGAWPLERVTQALTDFADLAVQLAMEASVGAEIRRGKLPGTHGDELADAGGMVAVAMGKMGAGELNYSSDIDLVCLFDETRFDPDDFHEARASFVRATRRMAQMLNDLTAEGYVFRTDLRLRPDPAVTPVCMAIEAAARYYESLGRTWERAAYVKARSAAGDVAAGERFLSDLTPFVWRRHLDFAAIRDAHDMRLRIRDHKGHRGRITLDGHDMKLGRGGIREIEFLTQTHQIIAGGRDPDLRVRGTVEGLAVLARKGWLPVATADRLADSYRAHREVEHRVQMIRDAQTHCLPTAPDEFGRLASLMDRDADELRTELRARLEEVHELTEGFFAPDPCSAPADDGDTFGEDIVGRWPTYPALRSGRAVQIFDRLRPEILSRLRRSAKPEEALAAFDGFLAGLPAGVQVFSLFEANTQLIDLLVDIVAVSPDLARYLSRNAHVLDAVIAGDFFADWPDAEGLRADLERKLAREDDYEARLDAARRWGKEWHFRAGVHLLRGLSTPEQAGGHYAAIAHAALGALWPHVVDEFSRKHGAPPGRGAAVLGMGSLGEGRLHARSDLDMIVVYDAAGEEASDGRKPLAARTYYARLTQALVTAMTAQTAEGKLYEIDLRLRPSGNQGPVATSLTAFRDYQAGEAWTWEHLALTRARCIAGAPAVAEAVDAVLAETLGRSREAGAVLAEVATMRARIASAKGGAGPWDPKVGRGRMQEIELLAQAFALVSRAGPQSWRAGLEAGVAQALLGDEEREALAAAEERLWALQAGARLVSDGAFDPETSGAGAQALILRLTGTDGVGALRDAIDAETEAAAEVIDAVLSRHAPAG